MKYSSFIIFLFVANTLLCQINTFVFQGVKDYNDQTRIAYFNISEFNDDIEMQYVKKEVLKLDAIFRFELYENNGSYSTGLIETTPEYDENKIKDLINQLIQKNTTILDNCNNDILCYYKEAYSIPDDCPIFEYYPITEENYDEFYEKTMKWKTLNQDKFNEIKHLRKNFNIPEKETTNN